jgi:hypothetical protein
VDRSGRCVSIDIGAELEPYPRGTGSRVVVGETPTAADRTVGGVVVVGVDGEEEGDGKEGESEHLFLNASPQGGIHRETVLKDGVFLVVGDTLL